VIDVLEAGHSQQGQGVGGGRGRVDDQPLVGVGDVQGVAVEGDAAELVDGRVYPSSDADGPTGGFFDEAGMVPW
jgi:hypothetical protein